MLLIQTAQSTAQHVRTARQPLTNKQKSLQHRLPLMKSVGNFPRGSALVLSHLIPKSGFVHVYCVGSIYQGYQSTEEKSRSEGDENPNTPSKGVSLIRAEGREKPLW